MPVDPRKPCNCGSLLFRRWHLISSRSFPPKGGAPQFLRLRIFDLLNDVGESSGINWFLADVFLKYHFERIVGGLQSADIAAWRKWTGGSTENISLDPDVQERLRELGYLQ